MSRIIERTSWIVVIILLTLFGSYKVISAQTATPEPAAKLSYAKYVYVDSHYVQWTLSVTNSGNKDSNSQTIQDTLPAGADWTIVEGNINCELISSSIAGRVKLSCDPFTVSKRQLNETKDDFVNGNRFIVISGVVDTCGVYTNTAVFNFISVRTATADVVCPATPTPVPTMTPTQIPATNTPNPTITPTPTISNPPTQIPTATFIPKPPNTGNTQINNSESPVGLFVVFAILASLSTGTLFLWRNR